MRSTIDSARSCSEAVPEAHAAVLRGSAITGTRFVDGAPFDADGPGTSDLDLTLVGADVLRYYSAFWIPGIHSKPLSDEDPDIAPELTPLRRQLMDMVHRPVNIQGTRDWLQHFRGDIMNQPYLTLVRHDPGTVKPLRILSYNILKGGVGREAALSAVISTCEPDIVILQEAYRPDGRSTARRDVRIRALGVVAGALGRVPEPARHCRARVAARPLGQARVSRDCHRRPTSASTACI